MAGTRAFLTIIFRSVLNCNKADMGLAIDQGLSIPVIDLTPTRTGTPEEAARTARDIYLAFKNVGFAYIKNHGVPQHLVDEAFAWVRRCACLHLLMTHFPY